MNTFEDLFFRPLLALIDPEQRVFVGYLFSAVILGSIAMLVSGISFKNIGRRFFDKRIWFHKSSQLDCQLFLFNGGLKAIVFGSATFGSLSVSVVTLNFLQDMFPSFEPFRFSYSTVVVLFTLASFVAMDFSRFFQHFCFHKIPWLWNFHKVHHSARVLTPMTLFRTHPVESLFAFVRRTVVVGSVSGVFIFATGSILGGVDIIGVNILDFVFNVLGSNLRHSHIWLSFGFLNRVLISPAQHQIHHSRAEKHFDKNFGVALSLWDQIFGTYCNVTSKKPFLVFGVRGEKHESLSDLLPRGKQA